MPYAAPVITEEGWILTKMNAVTGNVDGSNSNHEL